MSKLNEANDRLDAAMTTLEKVVEERRQNAAQTGAASEQNAQLQAELDKLKSDFATLRETSGTVSSRLDDAIGRLRNMLDE
jgi:seryl-tRNA synthetase